MSLFKSFKKALGFPDDYSNDLGDISDLEDNDEDIKIVEDNQIISSPEVSFEADSDSAKESDSNVIITLKSQIENLQKHVLSLEAEREQLQLENRYMAERIRGTLPEIVIDQSDKSSDYKELIEENESLKKQNSELKLKLENTLSVEEQEEFKKVIEKQIEKFEILITKKDSEIKSLQHDNSELTAECNKFAARVAIDDEKIDSLEKKVAELHKTIQTNLFDHASEQDKLNKEIKRLSIMLSEPDKQTKAPRKSKPKEKIPESATPVEQGGDSLAIDELMDSTEWFTAPQPGPRIKDPEVTENFGYKETARKKSQKFDENQLTLF